MRIAFIVERFPPDIGGSGIRFFNIAHHLSKNHEIDVFTLGGSIPFFPKNSLSFKVYRFKPSSFLKGTYHKVERILSHSFATLFRLVSRSYDLIDVDIWPFLPFFSAKLVKPYTPILVSWNVVWPFSSHTLIQLLGTPLATFIGGLSTHNITVSKLAKSLLVERVSISPEKITIIPNGLETKFFNSTFTPQKGHIIYVGRFEQQKRIDLLLKAFHLAKTRISHLKFNLVGSGSLYPKIASAARHLSNVTVCSIDTSNRHQLLALLRESWLFVSASEFETYGLSAKEALSLGIPVVSTNAPYNAISQELLQHSHNGLIVNHNDPQAIAQAIEHLYKHPKVWRTLSFHAKHSSKPCSWAQVAKITEKLYAHILNNSDLP